MQKNYKCMQRGDKCTEHLPDSQWSTYLTAEILGVFCTELHGVFYIFN